MYPGFFPSYFYSFPPFIYSIHISPVARPGCPPRSSLYHYRWCYRVAAVSLRPLESSSPPSISRAPPLIPPVLFIIFLCCAREKQKTEIKNEEKEETRGSFAFIQTRLPFPLRHLGSRLTAHPLYLITDIPVIDLPFLLYSTPRSAISILSLYRPKASVSRERGDGYGKP